MRQFNINTQQSQQRAKATIATMLDQLDNEEIVYCNQDKKYYNKEDTFTCAHCEETYHIDYRKDASNGAQVHEDNLNEYEVMLDINNYPEYD